MIIESLHVDNFVCYRNWNMKLPEYGLIGITGVNEDNPVMGSNAIGKSVLLDSITWALFGEIARKKKTNVMGTFNPSTTARIIFANGDSIMRSKTKTGGQKLMWNKSSGTPTRMQPVVNQELGISWETFKNCCMFSNDILASHFLHVADNQRKFILQEIANTLHFRVANKIAFKDLKTVKEEYGKVQVISEAALEAYQGAANTLEAKKKELEFFDKDKEKTISSHKARLKALEGKIKTKSILKKQEKDLLIEISDNRSKILNTEARLKKRNKAKLVDEITSMVDVMKTAKGVIEDYKARIASIKKYGVCPYCGTSSKDVDIETIKTNLSEEKAKKKFIEKKLKDKDSEFKIVEALESKIKATKEALELNLKIADEIKNRIEIIEHKETQAKTIRGAMAYINESRSIIEGSIRSSEESCRALHSKYAKAVIKRNKLKREVDLIAFWVRQTGQYGYQAKLIEDLVEELSYKASEYSQELTDGEIGIEILSQKITKSKKKNEIVINILKGGKARDFRIYSGGQKNRIEKAVTLGIMGLQGDHIKFKLFDEIGRALSQQGYDRVVQLMKQIFPDQQIFMATNNKEISRFFDYRIDLKMKNEQTHVDWRM